MTQEEKDLLIKDLCTRLPYGVKVNHKGLIRPLFSVSTTQYYQITLDNAIDGKHNGLELVEHDIDAAEFKPYLRPMSSMTEEEKKEYRSHQKYYYGERYIGNNEWETTGKVYYNTIDSLDWLNSHHFDYRGLIAKGLALEAPEDMYKNK